MAASTTTTYLGVDIAKATFDAALLTPDGKSKPGRFANDGEGFRKLERWLRQQLTTTTDAPAVDVPAAVLHACMEATAHYGRARSR